jgi:hypothetical protein
MWILALDIPLYYDTIPYIETKSKLRDVLACRTARAHSFGDTAHARRTAPRAFAVHIV